MGRQAAEESAARFATQGVDVAAESLQVLDLGDAGIVVAPAAATFLSDSTSAATADLANVATYFAVGGVKETTLTVEASGGIQPLAAPYWQLQYNGCFARWYVDSAYVDACYKVYKLINDGVSNKDYWTLQHWAVATETAWGLRSTWINSARNGGSTQSWADWGPRVDYNSNCTTRTVGVSYILVLTSQYVQCEIWDATRGAAAGSMKQEWRCDCWPWMGSGTQRALAYAVEVSVPQGGSAAWTLGMGGEF